jgi:hypothetical protein
MDNRRRLFAASCTARILLCWALGSVLAFATTDTPMRELNLYRTYGDSADVFDQTADVQSLTNGVGRFLKETIERCAERAAKAGKSPQSIGSMRGRWLEWAVLLALGEKELTPAYWQAEFAAVPGNFSDVLLWSKEYGPVILSCKTSLRERYKQADLEAVALRQHFQNARCFLITLDDDKLHVARIRKKIADKELLALQALYDETNADELFAFLKTLTLVEPPPKTLRSGKPVK